MRRRGQRRRQAERGACRAGAGWSTSIRAASSCSSRRTSMRCTRRLARKNLIHMHGELHEGAVQRTARQRSRGGRRCRSALGRARDAAARPAGMRPDVVWFGEMPYHMDHIYEAAGSELRPVRLDRHQRQRLSGRRLRRGGARRRRPHGRAQSRAVRRHHPVSPRPFMAARRKSCRRSSSGCLAIR